MRIRAAHQARPRVVKFAKPRRWPARWKSSLVRSSSLLSFPPSTFLPTLLYNTMQLLRSNRQDRFFMHATDFARRVWSDFLSVKKIKGEAWSCEKGIQYRRDALRFVRG